MSLYLYDNSVKEKLSLLIKLIDLYNNKSFSSDEIHHLFEVFVTFDIVKDKNFEWLSIIEDIKNTVNIDFWFYTSNKEDLESTPELFWEDVLEEKLWLLKENIKIYLEKYQWVHN